MNTPKVWGYTLSVVVIVLNILQASVSFIPQPWAAVVSALLGVAAFYKIIQSHTPTSLASAGYIKR